MPCSCGQKVERAQPKVQCAKCNELFHLQCVGILPADLEFLMNSDKSFFCNVCAAVRRKSIRSPPPPSIDAITTNSIVVESNSSNSSNLKSVVSLNQSDNFSESNNNQQVTLRSLYNLIVSLRSENARVHNLISDMHEDNSKLVIKTENMHSDILSMQRNLLEKDNAISLLTAEVNNLRFYISLAMDKFGAPLSSVATNDLSSASNSWSSAASHSHGEISTPTVVQLLSPQLLSHLLLLLHALYSLHTHMLRFRRQLMLSLMLLFCLLQVCLLKFLRQLLLGRARQALFLCLLLRLRMHSGLRSIKNGTKNKYK